MGYVKGIGGPVSVFLFYLHLLFHLLFLYYFIIVINNKTFSYMEQSKYNRKNKLTSESPTKIFRINHKQVTSLESIS